MTTFLCLVSLYSYFVSGRTSTVALMRVCCDSRKLWQLPKRPTFQSVGKEVLTFKNTLFSRPIRNVVFRDAIFPDFSGIPGFHKSKMSMKKLNFNPKLERCSFCCFNGEDVVSALS